jgi:hypothetical protein
MNYMEQPLGYIQNDSSLCCLEKSLYGLKQTPPARNAKMIAFLLTSTFQHVILT